MTITSKKRDASSSELAIPEKLYSEREAAKRLGVSSVTILRMRQTGRISYYRIGVRILYSESDHIQPFLEKCERKADQPKPSTQKKERRTERV